MGLTWNRALNQRAVEELELMGTHVDPGDLLQVVRTAPPMLAHGYDEDGRAELHFDDPFDGQAGDYSHTHSIWVALNSSNDIHRDRDIGRPASHAALRHSCKPPQPNVFKRFRKSWKPFVVGAIHDLSRQPARQWRHQPKLFASVTDRSPPTSQGVSGPAWAIVR